MQHFQMNNMPIHSSSRIYHLGWLLDVQMKDYISQRPLQNFVALANRMWVEFKNTISELFPLSIASFTHHSSISDGR
jgi:hypothetical protein